MLRIGLLVVIAICVYGALIFCLQAPLTLLDTTTQFIEKEKCELESVLAQAQTDEKNKKSYSILSSSLDSSQLVERLNHLELLSEEQRIRKAFFLFQSLVNAGTNAVPAIRDYFISGQNIVLGNYQMDQEYEYTPGYFKHRSGIFPNTTREGLVFALRDINSPDSIRILEQWIQITPSVDEVIKIGHILIETERTQSQNVITARAHALLSGCEPPKKYELLEFLVEIEDPDLSAYLMEHRLYAVNARLDENLLHYMDTPSGMYMQVFYAAFQDPELSNKEHYSIAGWAIKRIGIAPEACSIFRDYLQSISDPDAKTEYLLELQYSIQPNLLPTIEPADAQRTLAHNVLPFLFDIRSLCTGNQTIENAYDALYKWMEYQANPVAEQSAPELNSDAFFNHENAATYYNLQFQNSNQAE